MADLSDDAPGPPPERPRTRGDCVDGPRPCPWVSCRYHLWLDVRSTGRLGFVRGETLDDLMALGETCALDVADAGGTSLVALAELLCVRPPTVQTQESRALAKLHHLVGQPGRAGVPLTDRPAPKRYGVPAIGLPMSKCRDCGASLMHRSRSAVRCYPCAHERARTHSRKDRAPEYPICVRCRQEIMEVRPKGKMCAVCAETSREMWRRVKPKLPAS